MVAGRGRRATASRTTCAPPGRATALTAPPRGRARTVPAALLALIEARTPPAGRKQAAAAPREPVWRSFLRMSRYCLPLGLLLSTLCGALLFFGNEKAGAGKTAAIQPALPVLSAALAWGLGRQRVSFRLIAGIALTVVGTLLLSKVWDLSIETSSEAVGMALLCLQILTFR